MANQLVQLINEAIEIKQRYLDELFSKANVVGCGVGFKIAGNTPTDEPCVVISVLRKLPVAQLAATDLIPKLLGPIKTDVIETGQFRAFQNPQQKMRPAPPGVSIGHQAVTAGTFGCLVRRGGETFILSNNHVLANVNNARRGDAILQPGPIDGGTPQDKIAELADYVPIDFGEPQQPGCLGQLLNLFSTGTAPKTPGVNYVDCALARPLAAELVTPHILQIGAPAGIGAATLGTLVQKFGRTTGYTQGAIIQIDVTASIDYNGRAAVFHNQLMAGAMSQGGDSGSAVLDDQRRIVGLLFAGSDTTTLINPIQAVLNALQIEIVTG